MLFLSLVLIYRWWTAMRALIAMSAAGLRYMRRTPMNYIGDGRYMRTKLNDRRKQTILFAAIWSARIADHRWYIIHRRSHILQTSRRRRKALIAVHHRYMRTRLKKSIGVFQFPFWKTQHKGICFLLDAWQQCDLCSMVCTLQKRPRRCCAILLRNGNLYVWNLYSFCLLVKKLNPKHVFFLNQILSISIFSDMKIWRLDEITFWQKAQSSLNYKYYCEINRRALPRRIVKSNVSRV